MKHCRIAQATLAGLAASALFACSSSTADSGSVSATGGAVTTPPVTGGESGLAGTVGMTTGGAPNTGGTSQGGSAPSGGVSSATGGIVATGTGGSSGGAVGTLGGAAGKSGGDAGGGGKSSTAGGGTGGASGGAAGSGGGGAPSGATGGSSGAGGSTTTTPPTDPVPSPGCSATPTTTSCNTQSSPCSVDVDGTMRTYYVRLPDGYDPTHPYPVVWEYHPLGGNGWQGLTMYQIQPKMQNAIYVSPDGLSSGGNQGFANTDGGDEAMTRAINAELEATYCVDTARYFATGFSYGGSMSYTAACNMSDVFRAIGAMSGAPISGATCTRQKPERPVAIWATHGDMDTALPITMAEPIIESLVDYNGCSTDTEPVDPSPCVRYQNCMEGYPVVWCPRPGDPHMIPSFAAQAIADFFQQF